MFRAYIINSRYQRTFQSDWFRSESSAEKALERAYKNLGLNIEDPKVFGSGIEDDEPEVE